MTGARPASGTPPVELTVNGRQVAVRGDVSLLAALREELGLTGAKDGCSPQGQCGCCTVLVDGQPRVACVTPVRRVRGREVTTLEGLDEETTGRWADAFTASGASQCGFCTPGIVVRLAGLEARDPAALAERTAVDRALAAHLCRCTGWQTIREAAAAVAAGVDPSAERPRDPAAAARRATIEGRSPQEVGPGVALGDGGFADDTAPADALVAVPDGAGGWAVGESLTEARVRAGKVQGRRTTLDHAPPIEVPAGNWARTLRTSWTEPAYLETDASWCSPGGEPATPLGNGGAFGAKRDSIVVAAARELADLHGRPVRVLLGREDTVRLGAKRPPIAVGVDPAGRVAVRVARTPGYAELLRAHLAELDVADGATSPEVTVEEVDVVGPPTGTDVRAAGWAEAALVRAALTGAAAPVTSPEGARAEVRLGPDGVDVALRCGEPLDEVVLRSYCIGAVHMALGWVCSEAIAVDPDGGVADLTIRSFGILRPAEMPLVRVRIEPDDGEAVNGSDAVFAATAAAAWAGLGFPPELPAGVAALVGLVGPGS
ncbi:MAG: 2Fe-2S iron-sulfur cluster-binding protein [Actinomycetota bacterium]|nr:2Fe-2S iron-sulfur cluster-binding protein [Actinomycetota bacterium]